jgi:hypothetical protein
MKNALSLFVISIALVASSGCEKYAPPETELCINNGDDTLSCDDPRLPDGQQTYIKPMDEATNYLCTNPSDFAQIKDYCIDLRAELIKCEKSRRKPKH